jgi:hypothetical protein
MRRFIYFLRALLTFYFPLCQAPEKKEGGEVLNPETKEVL